MINELYASLNLDNHLIVIFFTALLSITRFSDAMGQEIQHSFNQNQDLILKQKQLQTGDIKSKQVRELTQIQALKPHHQKLTLTHCRRNFLVNDLTQTLESKKSQLSTEIFIDAIQYHQVQQALKPLLESPELSTELKRFLTKQSKGSLLGTEEDILTFLDHVHANYAGTSESSLNFNKNISAFLEHLNAALSSTQHLDQNLHESQAMLQILMHQKLKPLGELALQDKLFELSRLALQDQKKWITGKLRQKITEDKNLIQNLILPLNKMELEVTRNLLVAKGANSEMISALEQQNALQEFLLHPMIKRELYRAIRTKDGATSIAKTFESYDKLNKQTKHILAAKVIDQLSASLPLDKAEMELLMSKLQTDFKISDTDQIRAILEPWIALQKSDYEPLVDLLVKQWDAVYDKGVAKKYESFLSEGVGPSFLSDLQTLAKTLQKLANKKIRIPNLQDIAKSLEKERSAKNFPYELVSFLSAFPLVFGLAPVSMPVEHGLIGSTILGSLAAYTIFLTRLEALLDSGAKVITPKTRLAQKYQKLLTSEEPKILEVKQKFAPNPATASEGEIQKPELQTSVKFEPPSNPITETASQDTQGLLTASQIKPRMTSTYSQILNSKTLSDFGLGQDFIAIEKAHPKITKWQMANMDIKKISEARKQNKLIDQKIYQEQLKFIQKNIDQLDLNAFIKLFNKLKKTDNPEVDTFFLNLANTKLALEDLVKAENELSLAKLKLAPGLTATELDDVIRSMKKIRDVSGIEQGMPKFEKILADYVEVTTGDQFYQLINNYLDWQIPLLSTLNYRKFSPSIVIDLINKSHLTPSQIEAIKSRYAARYDELNYFYKALHGLIQNIPKSVSSISDAGLKEKKEALEIAEQNYTMAQNKYLNKINEVQNQKLPF